YRLFGTTVSLRLADGRIVRVQAPEEIRELRDSTFITLVPREVVLDAMRVGIRDVEVRGQVSVARVQVLDTLPWKAGTVHLRDGMRLAIEKATTGPEEPRVGIRAGGVSRPKRAFAIGIGGWAPQYKLVNLRTGEEVKLQNRMSESGPSGLVLPSSDYQEIYSEFEPVPGWAMKRPFAVKIDQAWLTDAAIIAYVEQPKGSYAVRWGSR
ncbi:MAG TPA: hypothetical protein VFV33_14995, partial [Gemmatimonadaceae bacterium]|nr:hypothetical protein [Gemmatimonadaceae bacterium]